MATTRYTNLITLTDAAAFNEYDTASYCGLTGVAGTNTLTATGPASLTAYAVNQKWVIIPPNTNTGATTLAITPSGSSALAARNVYFNGAACVGGELKAGVPALLIDDGTRLNIAGGFPSIPIGLITTKGDLLPGTAAGVVGRLAAGTNGYLVMADSSQTTGLNYGGRGGTLTFSTAGATVADGLTRYIGTAFISAADQDVWQRVPFACVVKNLYTQTPTATSGTRTYTLMVNGVASTLTCAASGANTQASDTSNTPSLAAGDRLSLKLVTSGGSDTVSHTATVELVKTGA